MQKISKPYKMKKIKYGTFSAIHIMVIIGIIIMVNLVFSKLDISYDLTKNKLYSISEESVQVLSQLEEEIYIYGIFPTNSSDQFIQTAVDTCSQIIDQYDDNSSKVHVEYIDPLVAPGFLDKYSNGIDEIATGSIIVEKGAKGEAENFRIIPPEDLATTKFDLRTRSSQIVSLDIEPAITNAISSLNSNESTVIYKVSNHNETPFPNAFLDQLKYNNYTTNDLDLFTAPEIPEDCELLFVTNPQYDWSKEEADKVLKYLQGGGRAIFALDAINVETPNLNNVLAAYGVEMSGYFTIEGEPENFMNNPAYLLPNFADNETAAKFQQEYRVLTPAVQSVNTLDLKKDSLVIEPILETSAKAYQNTDGETRELKKGPSDATGPFSIATAITDNVYTGENVTTKIVVLGSQSLLDESINSMVSGGNYQFLIDAMNWTQDLESSTYIAPKTIVTESLEMDSSQVFFIAFASIVVIPAIVFGTGIIVSVRRRKTDGRKKT